MGRGPCKSWGSDWHLSAILIFTIWHRKTYPQLTFLATMDALVIPASFAAGCIRIGNFINQEVLGIPSTLPWAVIFLHPVQGRVVSLSIPYKSTNRFSIFQCLSSC